MGLRKEIVHLDHRMFFVIIFIERNIRAYKGCNIYTSQNRPRPLRKNCKLKNGSRTHFSLKNSYGWDALLQTNKTV